MVIGKLLTIIFLVPLLLSFTVKEQVAPDEMIITCDELVDFESGEFVDYVEDIDFIAGRPLCYLQGNANCSSYNHAFEDIGFFISHENPSYCTFTPIESDIKHEPVPDFIIF